MFFLSSSQSFYLHQFWLLFMKLHYIMLNMWKFFKKKWSKKKKKKYWFKPTLSIFLRGYRYITYGCSSPLETVEHNSTRNLSSVLNDLELEVVRPPQSKPTWIFNCDYSISSNSCSVVLYASVSYYFSYFSYGEIVGEKGLRIVENRGLN